MTHAPRAVHRRWRFRPPPRPLVGTALSALLSWVKDLPGSDCGACSGLASVMDQQGPAWIRANLDQITARMVTRRALLEQSLRSLGLWGQLAGRLVAMAPDAVLRKGAAYLVGRAIAHAEAHPSILVTSGVGRGEMDRSLIGQHWSSEEALILTAADDRFAPGAYLALATAARFNDVPMAFVNLGCERSNPFVRRISRFARVHEWPERGAVKNWQTWFKPRYIQWGLTQATRVIWIDADTTTGGSLEPLSHPGWQVPDHGFYTPRNNHNRPEFYTKMPLPLRRWGDQMPCAGILGVGQEESTLLDEWRDRCDRAIRDPSIEKATGYYDQGILQDLLTCDLIDGRVFNNLQSRRDGTIEQIIEDSTKYSVVMHFGGVQKPWTRWGDDWCLPTGRHTL